MLHSLFFACLFFLAHGSEATEPQFLEKCRIESVDDQKIIRLKGTPYEIGYQHGYLLKEEIAKNIQRFITPTLTASRNLPPVVANMLEALLGIITYIPTELIEEMQGIAMASDQPFMKILLLNLFPEMFHCSAITANGDATANNMLYHVRVLDYSQGVGLQDTAVLAVVEPEHGHPFLNFTYAGFIGCVTGMNMQKIAIGEIGGKGYGYWDGIPMAFLLRTILQHASSLDEVKQILTASARTCEYFYIFSDGKTKQSFGCQATPYSVQYFEPGQHYWKTPPLKNTFDSLTTEPGTDDNTFYEQPKDILMITRGDNYNLLKERLLRNYGNIMLHDLQEAIKHPIAHKSNLHNAIFAPETLEVWISHAGKMNQPACDEPYHYYNMHSLIGH